jgi:hypothetical protein
MRGAQIIYGRVIGGKLSNRFLGCKVYCLALLLNSQVAGESAHHMYIVS